KTIIKSAKEIKTGLDISCGGTIVYQAKADDGTEISTEHLKKSEAVIKKRLEAKNIFDYIVRSDEATSQIYVEIPADINDKSKDPLSAVEGLDKTAKIEFRDPDGNVLLAGDDIKTAKYSEDPTDKTGLPSPHVVLTFSEEGTKKFAEATGNLVGKTLSIYLDTEEITAPTVNEKIESNTAIITMGAGTYTEKKAEAEEYAMLIDSGTLPFNLNVVSKEYIGPYVGQKALEISIMAGIVAFVIICIIMIAFYKLPGVISSIALTAYVAIVLLIMSSTGISLTLPGIAGLILSVGMAVDANVIIFERFKDELKNKLSPLKAFEKSFKTAMTAVIDGNVTTFAVAILLYIFGTGPVKGFGIVLAIGVVVSLLTAVIITKFILKQILPAGAKRPSLLGMKKEVK
ncbi:MAG: protein translocase subunit SecD, partial [Clostridia bacterium]|nr:protein translocase subunit SecD [Clostridia bacterium]